MRRKNKPNFGRRAKGMVHQITFNALLLLLAPLAYLLTPTEDYES